MDKSTRQKYKHIIQWTLKKLNVQRPYPTITLSEDREKARKGHHTGINDLTNNKIWIYIGDRNMIDVCRTIIHELCHTRQNQLNMVKDGMSYPGSPVELLADMTAGKLVSELLDSGFEFTPNNDEVVIDRNQCSHFIKWAAKQLSLPRPVPTIALLNKSPTTELSNNILNKNRIEIYAKGRNMIDIFRNIYHELTMTKNPALADKTSGTPSLLPTMSSGKAIKIYSKAYPEIFQ